MLFRKYILFETVEQIACEMNCTWRNVCHLHRKALAVFAKVMEDE